MLRQHAPDDGGGPFGDDRAARRAIQGYAPHESAGLAEMNLVGQRHAGPAPAAVSKVARDPDRIDARGQRRFQAAHQIALAHAGGVGAVMEGTAIAIGIEDRREASLRRAAAKDFGVFTEASRSTGDDSSCRCGCVRDGARAESGTRRSLQGSPPPRARAGIARPHSPATNCRTCFSRSNGRSPRFMLAKKSRSIAWPKIQVVTPSSISVARAPSCASSIFGSLLRFSRNRSG